MSSMIGEIRKSLNILYYKIQIFAIMHLNILFYSRYDIIYKISHLQHYDMIYASRSPHNVSHAVMMKLYELILEAIWTLQFHKASRN